jgi:hypothetical protein
VSPPVTENLGVLRGTSLFAWQEKGSKGTSRIIQIKARKSEAPSCGMVTDDV